MTLRARHQWAKKRAYVCYVETDWVDFQNVFGRRKKRLNTLRTVLTRIPK